MSRRKDWLILIGAAALFLLVPHPVRAQQPSITSVDSDDEDDEKPTPIASLTITTSEAGRAAVNFYITAGEPSTRSENQAAVEKALGCNLELDPRFSRVVAVVYGSCNLPLSAGGFHREGRIRVAPLADYARAKKIERLVVMIYLPDTDAFDSQPTPTSPAFGKLRLSSKALRRLDRNRVYSCQRDHAFGLASASALSSNRSTWSPRGKDKWPMPSRGRATLLRSRIFFCSVCRARK